MRIATVFLFIGLFLLPGFGTAQEPGRLAGAWRYSSVFIQDESGAKTELWDGKQNGLLIFSPDGWFALQIARADLPRLASGTPARATADESEAIAHGIYATFGTYRVDRARRTIVIQILGSTFPNEIGSRQERSYEISGDTLTYVNAAPSSGGQMAINVLKREK